MTMTTEDHALLANDSYNTHAINSEKVLGGIRYRVLDEVHDKVNGYQGTAYVREDTGDVVIAHCGTDAPRMKYQDIATDAGMVLVGVNAQMPNAMAFTKHALELGQQYDQQHGLPFNATITGHSLGGTLAEITAYRYGLKGETFNAYGAAGLLHDIPEGGHQVIDHVRATDVVSAASQHFGEVRIYASQQDIDRFNKAGYHDNAGPLYLANPVQGIDLDAHSCTNFLPGDSRLGHSIISPENAALYQSHKEMVDHYRQDVMDARSVVSLPWETIKAEHELETKVANYAGGKAVQGIHAAEYAAQYVGHEAGQAYDYTKAQAVQGVHAAERTAQSVGAAALTAGQYAGHEAHQAYDATKQTVEHGAHVAQHAASKAVQGASQALHAAAAATSREASQAYDKLSHPSSWFDHKPAAPAPRLDHPDHPDHTMFKQACGAVHQIDAEHGRTSDQHSANLAAALTVAAKAQGMNKIDQVHLSADGSHAFAAQNTAPLKTVAQVETLQALNTPVEHSTQQITQVNQTLQQQAQVQAQAQQQAPQPSNPAMMR